MRWPCSGWGGSAEWSRWIAMAALQRDVAVLPRRDLLALRLEHPQRLDQLRPGLGGLDDIIDVTALRGDVRVAELLLVRLDQFLAASFGIIGLRDVPPEDHVH